MADSEATTRAQILATATKLLRGNAKVPFTLAQLADHLEMHHTAIYHYFESKDHIVSELIAAACTRRTANLQRGKELGGTALEQLLEFIRLELNESPTDLLVRPIFLLSEPYREMATRSMEVLTRQIDKLVAFGISDGSVRTCSSASVAALLTKLLNRYYHRRESMLSGAGFNTKKLADEVIHIVRDGVAAQSSSVEWAMNLQPISFPVLSHRQTKQDVILPALTEAFNKQGYAATSIPRVAASIGVSKTSIYKYAETKTDLLYFCARHSFDLISQARQVASAVSRSPLEALLYNLYFMRQLEQGTPGPLLQPFVFQHHSPAAQLVLWEIFEKQRDNIRALFERGMNQGEIRELESVAAVPAFSVYSTYTVGPIGFADEVAQLFLTGLAAR